MLVTMKVLNSYILKLEQGRMGQKSMTIAVAVTLSQGTFAMTSLNGGLVIQWNLVLVATILGFFIR